MVNHDLIGDIIQIFSNEVYLEISQIVDIFTCHFASNQNGYCRGVEGEGAFKNY